MEAAQPPAQPPTQSPVPQKRIDPGRVISETFEVYGHNFAPLVGMGLVVFLVVGIVSGLLDSAENWFLSLLASVIRLAGTAIYTGFVVKLVQDTRDGKRDFAIGDLFSAAMPAVGALIINGILWGFGVGIGLVLLIVPGLILMTIWAVAQPAIVVEGRGPVETFGRSRELVRGEGWSVFGTIVLVWLILLAAVLITVFLGLALGVVGVIILGIILSALATPVFAVAVSVLFFDLGGGQGAAAAAPAAPAQQPPPPAAPTA